MVLRILSLTPRDSDEARRGVPALPSAARCLECGVLLIWKRVEQKLGLFPTQHAIAMGDKEYHSAVNIGATMKARYNNWRHQGW